MTNHHQPITTHWGSVTYFSVKTSKSLMRSPTRIPFLLAYIAPHVHSLSQTLCPT